jgi:acyl-CoA thioesterase-1
MNPIALYFASGDSFYFGAVLLLLAVVISPYLKRHWMLQLRNISIFFAFAMMVMACPPFTWLVDAIFFVSFLGWILATGTVAHRSNFFALRTTAAAILLTLLATLCAVELSHRKLPVISGVKSDHLVVIGDSISASIDPNVPSWPVFLQQLSGLPVKNLARPGALTIDGQEMAKQVTPEDHLVLIEIGGNDLLTGVPAGDYGVALDALLLRISAPGRTVVMFELPLLPHKISYGQIQRRVAARYGVSLIPKRYLIKVIGGANATVDGLHLSSAGAHHMAELVQEVFTHVIQSPARRNANSITS